VLLIADDIQAGCCRSGNFFSFERAGIVPDMVTVSKSIGGCGMPMALVLLRPELDIWTPGEHNGTFRGSQLSMVAAKAGLELMLNNRIEDKVKAQSAIIKEYLDKVAALHNGFDVRGIGFMWGIDCNKVKPDAVSRAIVRECFNNGLIVERAGRNNDVVKLMPPLVADEATLRKGLEILVKAVEKVVKEM
jgi:diaminobutyrate-2-oxoglutarate transaminase